MADSIPAVSVVIPVYNSEAYLGECIESVLGQTQRDIEVICVDDGSSDGSALILGEYAAADPRLRVHPQANAGCGAARNAGLSLARGEYVVFLDSDDVFEPNMIEEALKCAREKNCDVVAWAFRALADERPTWRRTAGSAYLKPLDNKTFRARDLGEVPKCNLLWIFAWNKLCRRSFLEEHKITFSTARYMEDVPFATIVLLLADRIAYMDRPFVRYRERPGSITKNRNSNWPAIHDAIVFLRDDLVAHGLYAENERLFLNHTLIHLRLLYNAVSGESEMRLHDTLHYEWLHEFELADKPPDYFTNKLDRAWISRILSADVVEAERANLTALEKAARKNSEEIARLDREIARVENSLSLRLGRLLCGIRRRWRSRI